MRMSSVGHACPVKSSVSSRPGCCMRATESETKNENPLSQSTELQDNKLSPCSVNPCILGWFYYTVTDNWNIYYQDSLITWFFFHFLSTLRQHIDLAIMKNYSFQVLDCGLEIYSSWIETTAWKRYCCLSIELNHMCQHCDLVISWMPCWGNALWTEFLLEWPNTISHKAPLLFIMEWKLLCFMHWYHYLLQKLKEQLLIRLYPYTTYKIVLPSR